MCTQAVHVLFQFSVCGVAHSISTSSATRCLVDFCMGQHLSAPRGAEYHVSVNVLFAFGVDLHSVVHGFVPLPDVAKHLGLVIPPMRSRCLQKTLVLHSTQLRAARLLNYIERDSIAHGEWCILVATASRLKAMALELFRGCPSLPHLMVRCSAPSLMLCAIGELAYAPLLRVSLCLPASFSVAASWRC